MSKNNQNNNKTWDAPAVNYKHYSRNLSFWGKGGYGFNTRGQFSIIQRTYFIKSKKSTEDQMKFRQNAPFLA